MEKLKELWARFKVQVSFVAGAIVVATAYGTCSFDPSQTSTDAEEPAAGGMVSVDQLMSALEKALEDVLGQEVEVSQDDDEAEMDMDLDMDAPDAGDELGLDADAEEEEGEEEELEEATPKTDVVEEVYARVIQRLTQETKSNKK